MKLSVFYHHLRLWAQQRDLSLGVVLDTARDLGITHVEVDRDDIADPQQFYLQLSSHDLKVANICGFYDWSHQPDDLRDELQLRQAGILHCDKVMPIPGFYSAAEKSHANPLSSVDNEHAKGSDRAAERERMLSGMRRFVQRAAAYGLTATIEDFDSDVSPIGTSQGMLDFQRNAPGLRTTFDTGNFYYGGEDVRDAMDALRGTIAHVHLKDRLPLSFLPAASRPEHPEEVYGTPVRSVSGELLYPCAVGSGCIPFADLLADLQGQGYDGCCSMEFFYVNDYEQAVRKSVAFLKGTGYFDV